MRYFRFSSFIIIISGIILSCANQEGPSGGPEDKTAPLIISVWPESGTANVPIDTKFEIVFSKKMDQTTSEEAIFVSPLFFDYPQFNWSGKKLEVIPPEKLRENTTYVLTIGSSAKDSRGNKLGTSMSYSFSTGQTIDKGVISGQVLNTGTQNLSIWAYKLESETPDSFWVKIPDYVTQPDSFGQFRIDYLGSGYYLVVAAEDKNSDQFWAPPGEKLALPDTIVYLDDKQQYFGPLIMMTVERDTLVPYINSVKSPDNRSVIVDFSQAMDSVSILSIANYRIFSMDDTTITAIPELIFPLDNNFKSVYIRCSELLAAAKYKLAARELKSAYHIQADTLSRMFNAGAADSIKPQLLSTIPAPSNTARAAGFNIVMTFSEPMDSSGFKKKFAFADSLDNPIEFELQWRYPNQIEMIPEFVDNGYYIFSYDERVIYDLNNNPLGDSLREFLYVTAAPDSFGQILGQVVNAPGSNVYVIVLPSQGEQIVNKVKSDGSFYIPRLFSGVYQAKAYFDKNNNGRYDGGGIRPFEFAEPVAIYADTIIVRARWETDIGNLDFKPHVNDVDTLR